MAPVLCGLGTGRQVWGLGGDPVWQLSDLESGPYPFREEGLSWACVTTATGALVKGVGCGEAGEGARMATQHCPLTLQ